MLFRCQTTFSVNSTVIPLASETKHLGVWVSSTLSWSLHVRDMLRRASYKVYILKRLVYRCGTNTFVKKMYLSLLQPVLKHAGPICDSCSTSPELIFFSRHKESLRKGSETPSKQHVATYARVGSASSVLFGNFGLQNASR